MFRCETTTQTPQTVIFVSLHCSRAIKNNRYRVTGSICTFTRTEGDEHFSFIVLVKYWRLSLYRRKPTDIAC